MKFLKLKFHNRCFVSQFVIFVGFMCIVSLSHAFSTSTSDASITEKKDQPQVLEVVARVNGVPITADMITSQVDDKKRKFKKFGMHKPNEEIIRSIKMNALEQVIIAEVLYQQAKKTTIADFEARLKEKEELLKQKNKTWEKMDTGKFKDVVKRQIYIEEYLTQKGLKEPTVEEQVVKKYYEENKQNFKRKDMAQTRHILVKLTADAKPEEKKAARKKIDKARQLIVDGKPFADVAKEYSECNSAAGGGELGYNEKGYMPAAFEKVAFSQKTGELSGVIESEHGYHILEVLDRREAGIIPYSDIKDFIWKYLNNQHAKQVMTAHLNGLKQKANIEIYL